MHNMETAYDSIRDSYDVDTLREIIEHGCISGVATNHIYYNQTVSFFNAYEEEITDYIVDNFGLDFTVNMFQSADAQLSYYKNEMCWCYIECIAQQIVDEFESTTCEELSLA